MTLAQKVYEGIREDILMGRYQMNEFLVETEVAEKYGVSKGTASEALHRLCLEGQLKSYPRKGYLLSIVTEEEFMKLTRLRIRVEQLIVDILLDEKTPEEIEALRECIESSDILEQGANMRFHMELAQACKDRYVISVLYNILSAQARSERYVTAIRMHRLTTYHEELLEALAAGDRDGAKEYVRRDILGR